MDDSAKFTVDDLSQAFDQIKRMQPRPPMRTVCSFDEAKALILAGRADLVLVSSRVFERLQGDPELASL